MSVKDLASTNQNTSEVWSEMFYIFFLILYFFFGWHWWISFKFAVNFGPCGIIFWGWTYYMLRKIQLTSKEMAEGKHSWTGKQEPRDYWHSPSSSASSSCFA